MLVQVSPTVGLIGLDCCTTKNEVIINEARIKGIGFAIYPRFAPNNLVGKEHSNEKY